MVGRGAAEDQLGRVRRPVLADETSVEGEKKKTFSAKTHPYGAAARMRSTGGRTIAPRATTVFN
jgi:hypothetical protein